MIAFMGKALAGARASSQDFFSLSVSVSAVDGGLRAGILDEAAVRCEGKAVSQKVREDRMRAGRLYLAAAGFSVAWWVSYVGVLRFGPGRRIEIYDQLGRI